MASKATMQPNIVMTDALSPKRALLLKTNNIFGPGVAETTKVIATKIHQVCKLTVFSAYQHSLPQWRLPKPEYCVS